MVEASTLDHHSDAEFMEEDQPKGKANQDSEESEEWRETQNAVFKLAPKYGQAGEDLTGNVWGDPETPAVENP